MGFFIKLLTILALVASVAWFIADPGFEPGIAVIGSLSVLLSTLVVENRNQQRPQQNQVVSKSSTGIQAGGDVQIGPGGKNSDAE